MKDSIEAVIEALIAWQATETNEKPNDLEGIIERLQDRLDGEDLGVEILSLVQLLEFNLESYFENTEVEVIAQVKKSISHFNTCLSQRPSDLLFDSKRIREKFLVQLAHVFLIRHILQPEDNQRERIHAVPTALLVMLGGSIFKSLMSTSSCSTLNESWAHQLAASLGLTDEDKVALDEESSWQDISGDNETEIASSTWEQIFESHIRRNYCELLHLSPDALSRILQDDSGAETIHETTIAICFALQPFCIDKVEGLINSHGLVEGADATRNFWSCLSLRDDLRSMVAEHAQIPFKFNLLPMQGVGLFSWKIPCTTLPGLRLLSLMNNYGKS